MRRLNSNQTESKTWRFKSSLLAATVFMLAQPLSANAQQQKDFSLSFSPDGKQMVYYSYRGEALPDLFIANVDGSNERQLTSTSEVWEIAPSWSPNGDSIIFSAGPSMGDLEIFSIKPDGTGLQQLTDGEGNGHIASWSPDGEAIVYSRFVDKENVEIRYLIPKSGKEHLMTKPNTGRNTNPVWSPDGKTIAFVSDRDEKGKDELYVTDPHFKHIKKITDDELRQDFVTWAPDSQQVLFSAAEDGAKNDIYSVNIDTKKLTRITDIKDEHEYFTAFTPDGKYLYMDKGNWSQNFFAYRAKWTGKKVKPLQVGGKDWVDTIAIMEKEFLAPMVGKWKGVTTQGNAKGRFEEVVNYQWGPNKKSIVVDMELYWDGEKYGEAKGLLGLDRKTQKVYYNLVMEDGTVIMQQQTNPGESAEWVMDVTAAGARRNFPANFRVKYYRSQTGWKSDILVKKGDEWDVMAVHEFSLLK